MSEEDESSLIDELIAEGESQTTDFKKSDILSNATKLATLMAAFANSTGGRILIGVCDDGTLEGMTAKKEHENHIMNIARDRCDPPLTPKFSVVKKTKGDIYVVKILRYRTFPHAVITREGRVYFIRVGTTVREVTPSELALLFESAKEEIIKKPKLELLLVDSEGNTGKKITVQPTFTKIKKVKTKVPPTLSYLPQMFKLAKQYQSLLYPFGKKEPTQDLVPIGIEVSNMGEAPAHGIRIFLQFPESCELIEQREAIGDFAFLITPKHKPTSGGLFVDRENRSEAWAWIETLGNDLTMRKFDKVYVRFPPTEQEYKVTARITQHNFPPEDFEFIVSVKPNLKEKIEYVHEEEPRDKSNSKFETYFKKEV
jgi:hypothetical protein